MRTLFEWLDSHPGFYWSTAWLATAALIAAIILEFRQSPASKPGRGRFWIFGLLLVVLVAWRWPYLFAAHEYNPDESHFIAGAMALRHDPIFWRSVDGMTSGPLNIYALLPLTWLGLPVDYFMARLTGLLLCWGGLCGLYRVFRTLAAPGVAGMAVLPGISFFAGASEGDFVHYSSELLTVFLLGLALPWISSRPKMAAFMVGCLPWAKLQAGPLAAAFVAWQLWHLWRAGKDVRLVWRPALGLVFAAALPTFLVASGTLVFGEFESMFRRYLLQNIAYVHSGAPLGRVVGEIVAKAFVTKHFPTWVAANVLLVAGAGLSAVRQRQRLNDSFLLGALLSVTAVLCVFVASRAFLHYLVLLVIPLALWSGAALCAYFSRPRHRGLVFLSSAIACLPLLTRPGHAAPDVIGKLAEHWRQPRTALGELLHYWAAPNHRMVVWGWLPSAYVESGIAPAISDVTSEWSITALPQRDYYRTHFLRTIRDQRPALFVDSVGPGAQFFRDRANHAHEDFPALNRYIDENYRFIVDLGDVRVYVRQDIFAEHPLSSVEIRRHLARGRCNWEIVSESFSATGPRAVVDGRTVQMLEPPGQLHWALKGNERRIKISFGFHPRAFKEGQSDGATVIAQLEMPGQPALEIFRRLLDPARLPADRSLQQVILDLPPFPSGTTLVVRTTPGEQNDGAWDWVFLQQMAVARFPFYMPDQFPGFGRLPEEIAAGYPHLINREGETLLMLPAPATLSFLLEGTEREVELTYGMLEGAFTADGATDGVVYRVELDRRSGGPETIFERRLDPLKQAADRGRQTSTAILPANVVNGDRLVLHIDPASNSAWDWSYLATFELH